MRLYWQPCDINSTEARLVSFFLFPAARPEIRTMADNKCLWLSSRCETEYLAVYLFSLSHSEKVGRRPRLLLLFHSFKRPSQCPQQSIHTRHTHRPIGRSYVFHGHPVGHPDESKRQSTLRKLLHELLKNEELLSLLCSEKKQKKQSNTNQKHFWRVCYRSQVTQSPTRSRLLRKDGPPILINNSLWRWWSVALRLVSWAVIFCDAGSHHSCFFFS